MSTITVRGNEIALEALSQKTIGELVAIHNANLHDIDPDARKVERFATKDAAIRRTWGTFVQLAALGEAADKPEPAPKAQKEPKAPKQPKAPKAPKSEGEAKSGKRSAFSGKKLYATSEENPRREGTHGFNSMAIILANPGITHEEFIAKGGRNNDLAWDLERNHVALD